MFVTTEALVQRVSTAAPCLVTVSQASAQRDLHALSQLHHSLLDTSELSYKWPAEQWDVKRITYHSTVNVERAEVLSQKSLNPYTANGVQYLVSLVIEHRGRVQ